MYCGNNAKDPGLLSGQKVLGTSYECFRRGVGVGKNLPRAELEVDYEAIHKNRIFCGKKFGPEREGKYDRMGTPSECLRKGVIGNITRKRGLIKKRRENSICFFSILAIESIYGGASKS